MKSLREEFVEENPYLEWKYLDSSGIPDMNFVPGRGASHRVCPVDLIVLHWTGGEGDSISVNATLQKRRLGVDFVVDGKGMIVQYANPQKHATMHCGKQNHRSIGIEIVNYGFRSSPEKIPVKGRDRGIITDIIHHKHISFACFRQSQKESVLALVQFLCQKFDIPLVAPAWNTVIQTPVLLDFRGIVGHFHLSLKKVDPGTEILEMFPQIGMEDML